MGLCKCPKRRVTQNFCFEHKVNVCDFCAVLDHEKCIIQAYLDWLEDSSYDVSCRLCQMPLSSEECLRLTCYHIFHLRCINNLAIEKGGINIHPSQHTCPDCRRAIFPMNGSSGPIWDQIHSKLVDQEWARYGLSQPTSSSSNGYANHNHHMQIDTSNHVIPQVIHNNPNAGTSTALPINVSGVVTNFIGSGNSSGTRTRHGQSESHIPLLDVDEDKYQTKPASEFLSRWFRNRRTSIPRAPRTFKHWIIAGVLLLICFVTLVHYLVKLGRESASRDLSLDPDFNPNIRVGDD